MARDTAYDGETGPSEAANFVTSIVSCVGVLAAAWFMHSKHYTFTEVTVVVVASSAIAHLLASMILMMNTRDSRTNRVLRGVSTGMTGATTMTIVGATCVAFVWLLFQKQYASAAALAGAAIFTVMVVMPVVCACLLGIAWGNSQRHADAQRSTLSG
jgi:uncharacterized membrane protein